MFGTSPEIKKFQKMMKKEGADMKIVRSWCKSLRKMRKNLDGITEVYRSARSKAEKVDVILKKMEQVLIITTGRVPTAEEKNVISSGVRELKRYSGGCDHIFVISLDDREFHLTYDTILKLGENYSGQERDRLILQSEVENLLALTKENLDKEQPDMMELSFFYLRRSDKELSELPPSERLAKVRRVYQHEFMDKISGQVKSALGQSDEEAAKTIGDLIHSLT